MRRPQRGRHSENVNIFVSLDCHTLQSSFFWLRRHNKSLAQAGEEIFSVFSCLFLYVNRVESKICVRPSRLSTEREIISQEVDINSSRIRAEDDNETSTELVFAYLAIRLLECIGEESECWKTIEMGIQRPLSVVKDKFDFQRETLTTPRGDGHARRLLSA